MFPKTLSLIAVSFFLLLNASPLTAQSASNAAAAAAPRPPYLDPSLPVEQRVNDLVSRMTLEEKASCEKQIGRAHV